jgi:hypothetical protein
MVSQYSAANIRSGSVNVRARSITLSAWADS